MSRPKILVVEDHDKVAETIMTGLEVQGFDVVRVSDGAEAMPAVRRVHPDLVLLDLNLPSRGGLEICRELRADPAFQQLPIVMLTALDNEVDRIVGLEVGADDYIPKPFNIREVGLRLKAVLRRGAAPANEEVSRIGTLMIDSGRRTVQIGDEGVTLTAKEFDLLNALVDARGRALSRERLLRDVWGYDTNGVRTRTIDVHILQLRRKLGPEAWRLETLERFGYRLNDTLARR